MTPVLELQKFSPIGHRYELDVVLISTYSGVCPTVMPNEDQHFEME